jgi:hypothetical protein
MPHLVYNDNMALEVDYLHKIVGRQATKEAYEWLQQKLVEFIHKKDNTNFSIAFAQAPRVFGKEQLELTDNASREADIICTGLKPHLWTLAQAARILMLVSLPHDSIDEYTGILDNLFSAADVDELVALYSALPLLPYPDKHIFRAQEAIRSNMTIVFDSAALNNPFPAMHFDENSWNQMVLKAVFIGRSINDICNFDQRRNEKLAKMLVDYARERWAAKRPVTPELWRAVGPFLTERSIEVMKKLFESNDPLNNQAAALACAESNDERVQKLLHQNPNLEKAITNKQICWEEVAESYNSMN